MGRVKIYTLFEWVVKEVPFYNMVAAFVTEKAAEEYAKNRPTDTHYKILPVELHSKYPSLIITETV